MMIMVMMMMMMVMMMIIIRRASGPGRRRLSGLGPLFQHDEVIFQFKVTLSPWGGRGVCGKIRSLPLGCRYSERPGASWSVFFGSWRALGHSWGAFGTFFAEF